METINRYIFTLNVVRNSPRGHISEVELRKRIKNELERSKSFEMDKKTLKRIVEYLRREGLVMTRNFRVTIYQSNLDNNEASDYDALCQDTSLLESEQLQ